MAGERRSYRNEEAAPEEEYEGEAGYPERGEQAPAPRRTAPRPTARPTKPATKQQSDGEFVTITGLFPTKSGKADTAFIKPDIFEKIQEIQEGDTIGVSMNTKTNRLQLWYIRKG
jgi:hypothetical protein